MPHCYLQSEEILNVVLKQMQKNQKTVEQPGFFKYKVYMLVHYELYFESFWQKMQGRVLSHVDAQAYTLIAYVMMWIHNCLSDGSLNMEKPFSVRTSSTLTCEI